MPNNLGWIPPEQRTRKQHSIAEQIIAAMRPFFIARQTASTEGKRVVLWDFSRKVLGDHIPTLAQKTGSCVGNGAWNAAQYAQCVEIVQGDRERYEVLFMPYHYGRGRLHSGLRGRGEGSIGSGQAKAIVEDGVLANDDYGNQLPLPHDQGGLTWGADLEMQWSDGARIKSTWVTEGRKHLFKSAAPIRSYSQARDALCNGYPITVASMRGFQMRPVVDRGKHWGKPRGQWAHQMCFVGVDDDRRRPGLYCLNSWGPDAHGTPADDAPPGGFWVDADVADSMFRQDDSFAFSQFDGFPEQELDYGVLVR